MTSAREEKQTPDFSPTERPTQPHHPNFLLASSPPGPFISLALPSVKRPSKPTSIERWQEATAFLHWPERPNLKQELIKADPSLVRGARANVTRQLSNPRIGRWTVALGGQSSSAEKFGSCHTMQFLPQVSRARAPLAGVGGLHGTFLPTVQTNPPGMGAVHSSRIISLHPFLV
ncbi:hypothetical protein N7462_010815 [Penicillium macrosclerotiorum]|uniref:uncharacterized protein n=1 Tax=Penicillium macrosclerotiorum TaxID=303699 RepID=UPI00254671B2|nr:uncharacterized protein N7462_010815 [Penicillium macrosclerotiorum]KAJ5669745.1 hypothetical protein N7462_010815 [Penicillium macrosclerotiorum]